MVIAEQSAITNFSISKDIRNTKFYKSVAFYRCLVRNDEIRKGVGVTDENF